MTAPLELEYTGGKTFACDCCGSTTSRVWGWVHEGERTRSAYFVDWTQGGGPHPPHVTLGYGAWGEGRTADDRVSIYAEVERGRVHLVDHPAPGALPDEPAMLGRPMRARDVQKRPDADDVEQTLDFILRNDERIRF